MKCLFPNQTRDAVERLWHKQVLKQFPRYGEFWQEFIGVRVDSNTGYLFPYLLNVTSMGSAKQDEVQRIHELICMTHYSLFCHLAAAHRMGDELVTSMTITDDEERHFRYWQSLESGYLHLGAAWQQVKKLWQSVLENMVRLDETNDADRGAVWTFFKQAGREATRGKMDNMQAEVIDFRDDVAHFARFASQKSGSKYMVPKHHGGQKAWSLQHNVTAWEDATLKFQGAISMCESTFDEMHGHLIPKLASVLHGHSIVIDHATGQADVICKTCGWWAIPTLSFSGASAPASGSAGKASGSGTVTVVVGSSVMTISAADVAPSGIQFTPSPSTTPPPVPVYKCMNKDCGQHFTP